ncbi:hypothetical protein V7G70_17745 [Acinetobacter pittii]|uniref:hypothetical protein n=1 Tax=Acinetobacter pittii TaxID=48296 RepID=UPI002FF1BED0
MKKLKIAFVCVAVFSNMSANAKIWDLFGKRPDKPDTNNSVVSDKAPPKPFDKYFVVNSRIYDVDTLSDYVGRIIVIYKDSEGRSKTDIRVDKVLNDIKKKPSLKLDNEVYQSILLDSSDAATFGLPLVGGNISKEDKISYKFFKTANSSVSTDDLNKQKYLDLEKAVKAEFSQKKDLILEDVKIITSAAILNTSYASMKKSNKKANVAVPGWQVGGEFYSYQGESKEQFHNDIGIITSRFTPEIVVPAPSIAQKPAAEILAEVTQQPLNNEPNGSTTGSSPAYVQEDAKRKADDGQRQAEAERVRHIAEEEAKRKAEVDRARHSAEEEAKRKAEADRARYSTAAEAKLEAAKSTAPNISLSGKQGIRILDSQKSPSEATFKNVFQIK